MICDSEGMIPVPGGRVWYRIVGKDAPGVRLLVLHGGPGAPHDYLENLGALANERPVVFYDQLGCGRFDEATPATVEDFCRLIPGARMQIFEDASHNHHLEQSQVYLAAVRELLL